MGFMKKRTPPSKKPSSKTIVPRKKHATPTANGPSAEELHKEKLWIAQKTEEKRQMMRASVSASADPLAAYMDHLSHLSLFSAQQEAAQAKLLEVCETETWKVLLAHFLGAQETLSQALTLSEEEALPNETLKDLGTLVVYYQKHKKGVPKTLLTHISGVLRAHDLDKVLLNKVFHHLKKHARTHATYIEGIAQIKKKSLDVRNAFVSANLRLVVSVARHFHHQKISFIDLIQEGNVGLMKAVHRFDHNRGFRFSTYAHWWIRQSIERAIINKASQVRLPVHVIDARRHVQRAITLLTHTLGYAPSVEEIAAHLKEDVEKISLVLSGIQQDPSSLDDSVGSDDPRTFIDMVKDENTPLPDEALMTENTLVKIRELLLVLNPIERDIIKRRFGLSGDTDQTLDEIGHTYNLSRERVRQIQAQGLMKMKRMCDRRKIT